MLSIDRIRGASSLHRVGCWTGCWLGQPARPFCRRLDLARPQKSCSGQRPPVTGTLRALASARTRGAALTGGTMTATAQKSGFRKLLVPLDGTAEAAVALPLARTLAHATGG